MRLKPDGQFARSTNRGMRWRGGIKLGEHALLHLCVVARI